MKKIYTLILLIFLGGNYLSFSQAKNFKLNENVATSSITFFSKSVFEDISGNVEKGTFNSSISFDIANPSNTKGNVSLKVSGMKTGMATRDKHLLAPDWLDEAKYPNIVFEITKLDAVKSSVIGNKTILTAVAVGKFIMHGISKEMSIPITITHIAESDVTKKRAPGDFLNVEGKFDIKWKDFGVKGKKGTEGKVGETINCEIKLFFNNK